MCLVSLGSLVTCTVPQVSFILFIYLFFALAAENGAEEAVSVQTWSCGFNSEPVVSSAHKLHLPNVVSQDVVVL